MDLFEQIKLQQIEWAKQQSRSLANVKFEEGDMANNEEIHYLVYHRKSLKLVYYSPFETAVTIFLGLQPNPDDFMVVIHN